MAVFVNTLYEGGKRSRLLDDQRLRWTEFLTPGLRSTPGSTSSAARVDVLWVVGVPGNVAYRYVTDTYL